MFISRATILGLISYFDKCFIYSGEKKKIRDKRRVAIYSKIQLSDEQKKEIDDFYKKNYGKKIPYTWHRLYTAYTGHFDAKYFPELLYISEFETKLNYNSEYNKVFADKNVIPLIAKSVGIFTPKCYVTCTNGCYRNELFEIISRDEAIITVSNIGEAFIKPTIDSCSGRGCRSVNFINGEDTVSGKNTSDLFCDLGNNFAIQEKIICHDTVRKLHPSSVNTFRVITYILNNVVYAMPVIMRIGRGNNDVDNAHAGGMFIAVDSNGKLHKEAFTEFRQVYKRHPDTDVVFENYMIKGVEKVVESAKKMQEAIPQLGTVNWDFTINENGEPLLIEANTYGGSIWLVQMAHGCGGFGENTAEVLKFIRNIKE